MVSVHQELELKYDVDAGFELPSLPGLVVGFGGASPLTGGDAGEHRLEATYFDTADHRLARAGLTLRRRSGGQDDGWHLKIPGAFGARQEIRMPLAGVGDIVPAAFGNMVWARTRGEALAPVARITTDRTVRHLLDASGQVLIEVADDRVEAHRLPSLLPDADDGEPQPLLWREIEVELVHGSLDLLAAVDVRLRHLGMKVASSRSKLARVLDHLDSAPEPSGTSERLSPESSAGDAVVSYLSEQVEQVLAQDVQVRVDSPESIHKMRVATRRLRSALKTFKPLFTSGEVRPVRAELKWLAGELGTARDAEVLRERMLAAIDAEGEHLHLGPVAGSVDGQMSQAYRTAHDALLKNLDSARYHRLVDALAALVNTPPVTDRAARTAGQVLPHQVARTYSALRDLVRDALAASAVAERDHLLHEARKAAKRARYAGEAVSLVFGKDASTFAGAMEDLQEELGEHQDSIVMRERLQELARNDTTPGAAFAYGRVHAQEEARGERSVERFRSAWKTSSKKSLRRWLR